MKDFFTQLGIEEFSDKVADKVIERGSDRIAERVAEKIKPFLGQNTSAEQKSTVDAILTRKETTELLKVSEPTLRKMYREGQLKVYGTGTRRMRLKRSEVLAALDKL